MATTRYVWGKSTPMYIIAEGEAKATSLYSSTSDRRTAYYIYGDSYDFDPVSGNFTLKNTSSGSSYYGSGSIPAGKYFSLGFSAQDSVQRSVWHAVSSASFSYNVRSFGDGYFHEINISGSTKYYYSEKGAGENETIVTSEKSNQYPSNNIAGVYWYVLKGTDNIDPASVSYTDAVSAGKPVTITITPSTGTTFGGNISYILQTTTNGTDWYDAGETSETSYTVTVPADAIVWNVRVYAKDDTGFISSTYIYGNGVDTYVNVIRVGISPDSGDIGYITSPQVMFVSINTDTEYTFTVKLDGETLSSSSSSSTIQHIILSEEKFNSLKEETKYTLTIEIVQSGAAITRTYTFKKFVYDDSSLGGVFDGAAKALRIKRKIQSQIVGANIPKEIIKIDNPIGVSDLSAATSGEAQVFKGYTFFSGDNELKTGTALGTPTTATAGDIVSGKTAYDNLGNLITGGSNGPVHIAYGDVSFNNNDGANGSINIGFKPRWFQISSNSEFTGLYTLQTGAWDGSKKISSAHQYQVNWTGGGAPIAFQISWNGDTTTCYWSLTKYTYTYALFWRALG